MSELKEHLFCECDECIREYRGPLSNEMRPYYLKSEADKVIADLEESHKMEVEQLLMEIVELKEKYKELAKLHDKAIQACCDVDKVIAHQKFKRCLDKVEMLEHVCPMTVRKAKWKGKWHIYWLELAEKFKEVCNEH